MIAAGRVVDLTLPDHAVRPLHPGSPAAAAPAELLDLPVPGVDGLSRPLRDRLVETDTDAFVVVHAGRVALEWYRDEVVRDTPQALMSITKSVVGVVAGRLIGQGLLDPERAAADYVPELLGGGYAGVTVRDLLDMRTGGLDYDEDDADPAGELAQLAAAVAPALPQVAPPTLRTLVASSPRAARHAGPFAYRSLDTDALGWVLERASGRAVGDLVAQLLADVGVAGPVTMAVDSTGTPQCSGGLAATALDVARFALLLLHGGSVGDTQVVPVTFVKDTRKGAPDSADAFRRRVEQRLAQHDELAVEGLRTGHYRNQIWVPRPTGRALMCLGIHGQCVLIDPDSDAVVVKLSSWLNPQDPSRFTDATECARIVAATVADLDPKAGPWVS